MAAPAEAAEDAVQFALAPGRAVGAIIDYSTSEGIKLYRSATYQLVPEDEHFNVEPSTRRALIKAFADRSFEHGWNASTLSVPDDLEDELGAQKNLLTQYGEISLEHLRAHAETYVDTETRAAQDSLQQYLCLMASLSPTGKQKVTIWEADYTVNGIPCGALLFKVIMRAAHIDTHATSMHIRKQIASLDKYMATINSDITRFNEHAQELIQDLAARGETTTDLLTNLFEGYLAVSDKNFVQYVERKQQDYDEGQDIDPDTLMILCENKFKILKQRGQWNAPSAEEEKIIALEAQIKSLERKAKNFKKPKDNSNEEKGKKSSKDDKKTTKWFLVPPTAKEKGKPKTVNGREYWWCPNHKKWVRHKPEECNGINTDKKSVKADNKPTQDPETKKKLALAKAMESIVESDQE